MKMTKVNKIHQQH